MLVSLTAKPVCFVASQISVLVQRNLLTWNHSMYCLCLKIPLVFLRAILHFYHRKQANEAIRMYTEQLNGVMEENFDNHTVEVKPLGLKVRRGLQWCILSGLRLCLDQSCLRPKLVWSLCSPGSLNSSQMSDCWLLSVLLHAWGCVLLHQWECSAGDTKKGKIYIWFSFHSCNCPINILRTSICLKSASQGDCVLCANCILLALILHTLKPAIHQPACSSRTSAKASPALHYWLISISVDLCGKTTLLAFQAGQTMGSHFHLVESEIPLSRLLLVSVD